MSKIELAAAIVLRGNRVLIVRRSKLEGFLPRQWGVPCGKVDIDNREDAQTAVLRELEEETGLKGRNAVPVGCLEFKSTWRGQPAQNIQYNFLVELDAGFRRNLARRPRVTPPRPDQRAKWVRQRRLHRVGLDEHNLKAIRQGLAKALSSARSPASPAAAGSYSGSSPQPGSTATRAGRAVQTPSSPAQ